MGGGSGFGDGGIYFDLVSCVCVCLVYVLSTTLYLFMFPFIYLCAFVGWLSVGNVRVELLNIYR